MLSFKHRSDLFICYMLASKFIVYLLDLVLMYDLGRADQGQWLPKGKVLMWQVVLRWRTKTVFQRVRCQIGAWLFRGDQQTLFFICTSLYYSTGLERRMTGSTIRSQLLKWHLFICSWLMKFKHIQQWHVDMLTQIHAVLGVVNYAGDV